MIVPPRVLSDDELLAFSERNSGWHIEREPDGSLSVAPTSLSNAARVGPDPFSTRPDCRGRCG